MKTLHLTAIIRKENPMYTSWCPELDICSQGKTIDIALANLKEAIEFYIEDKDAVIPEELLTKSGETSPVLACFDVQA